MNILVTVASKHGATAEIASRIAATLREDGHEVEVLAPPAVRDVTRYDAVILGSGVYAGRWIGSAKEFGEANADALRARPVWLLSSGPLGETPKPAEDPADATKMVELLHPRGHRVFAGSLSKEEMGFAERAIIGMVKAPYGDFRNWSEITAWAHEIARELDGASAELERIPA
ncbi:MAG TPA: flavodoxin domain-containing protein [Candidatus Limnocylindria bacterium]|nr:flavodoxin domain-containing protein [Candidatus Limnocylindria bacterium]